VVGILAVDLDCIVYRDPRQVFKIMKENTNDVNPNGVNPIKPEDLLGEDLMAKLRRDFDKYEIRGDKLEQVIDWALHAKIAITLLELIESGEVDVINVEPVEMQLYEPIIASSKHYPE